MITAVDTNILLDILKQDPLFCKSSKEAVQMQGGEGSLIISPVVYSELLGFFLREHKDDAASKLDEFMKDVSASLSGFEKEDLVLAARAWQRFSSIKAVVCPKCGASNSFSCRKCNSQIAWRNHILTDFLIGAHAQNHADVLLTRDSGYYRKYFTVKVLP